MLLFKAMICLMFVRSTARRLNSGMNVCRLSCRNGLADLIGFHPFAAKWQMIVCGRFGV